MCRMNVVTFIFISGGLLLKKQEDFKEWIKKRVLRIVLVIVIFSLIYYPVVNFDFFLYFRTLLSMNVTNAYWYLYLYLGLMLLLPCLRVFAQNARKFEFIILFLLFLLFQSVYPILVHYCGFPELQYHFSSLFTYWAGWIIIFLFGFYYDKFIGISYSRSKICILMVIWLVGNLLPTGITYHEFFVKKDTGLFLDNPFFLWSIIATFSLIIMIDMICRKSEGKFNGMKRVIEKLAPLTFGIYLLSDKLLIVLEPYFKHLTEINAIGGVILWDISVFILGTIITFFLKLIPGLNRIL